MVAAMTMNNPHNLITIDDKEIDARSVGRIVMWQLSSATVGLDALMAALTDAGSEAKPPTPVSAKVALHRAVEAVADTLGGCEALLLTAKQIAEDDPARKKGYQRKRGDWAVVRKQKVAEDSTAAIYPIVATARLAAGDRIEVDTTPDAVVQTGAEIREMLEGAFDAAGKVLAPPDVGSWLCDKLRALDAVPLKQNGGVYFIPKDRVAKWDRLVAALTKASTHRVHGIPAMRTQDAVDAILAAITAETRAECERMTKEIAEAGLGARALETREKETDSLLGRLERYEGLLGGRLDELRAAIEETRTAVATARMTLATEEV